MSDAAAKSDRQDESKLGFEVFKIIPMGKKHLDEIMVIEMDSFGSPWREDDFKLLLKDKNVLAVVGTFNRNIAAYAAGLFVNDEFHLANFAVARDKRGKGLGSALLEWILERVQKEGSKMVTLEVRMSNDKATSLYTPIRHIRPEKWLSKSPEHVILQ